MASVSNEIANPRGFMREPRSESASRYLAMALASRKLMNRLDTFAETGELDQSVVDALSGLLQTMDTKWQTTNSFAPVPGQSPFGRYEQSLIVNEAAGADAMDVQAKLVQIIRKAVQGLDRTSTVRDINRFLYTVENRALHKYNEYSFESE